MRFGDESGIFWHEAPRERATRGLDENRPLPAIPDTGWLMPTEFPDLSGQGMIAIDCETHDQDLSTKGPGAVRGAYICGVAIGTEAGYRQYFPVEHKIGPNLDKGRVYSWLNEQLSRPGQPKVGANLQYDLLMLLNEGIRIEGPFYDVQIAEPLLNENRLKYSLEVLAQEYLGEGKDTEAMYLWLKDAFGDRNIKGNIWRAPPVVIGPYAESDVDRPLRIFRLQKKLLIEQGLWDLFILESKLLPFLVKMHLRGVKVNLDKARKLMDVMQEGQDTCIKKIKHATGLDADIWAADSLGQIYDSVGVAYPRTLKTNKPSFTKEWLEYNNHPISNLIKQARHYDKFKGTFLNGYILEGSTSGRLHTIFNQLKGENGGTVSGRLSSSGPNLQNIPVRTKEGKLIREMFEPEEDEDWYALDWSQVEYRLIVHYAYATKQPGSQIVVDRYRKDSSVDYHQIIADLTGLSRSDAKGLNFGLAYGMGILHLCSTLGWEVEVGTRFIEDFHSRAPYIRPLMKQIMRIATDRGYIKTLLGRRRRFDVWEKRGEFIDHYEPGFKRAFTHKSLNGLMQGSAADLMKKAMVDCHESGAMDVLGVPLITVHDELDLSVPRTKIGREAVQEIKHIMETCVELEVPLKADVSFGANWGLAKG